MRVFYASHSSATEAPGSRIWDHNLFLPLKDLGHEVVRFAYDLDAHLGDIWLKRHGRGRLERALLNQIQSAHAEKRIDLFFSYFDASMVSSSTIRQIRALGIDTVNWYCNASYQFANVAPIAAAYDYCLVPEKFRLEDYRRIGASPIYCQEAANPNFYKPCPGEFIYDISFVGQGYGDRPLLVQKLLEQGIRVHAFGPGWKNEHRARPSVVKRLLSHTPRSLTQAMAKRLRRKSGTVPPQVSLPPEYVHGPLSDEDMVKTFSRTRINLGFSACGSTAFDKERIKQVRLRDFEIPMSGGFYLTEHLEELGEFFELGKEVVCYRDGDDLVEKVKYFLAEDEEREAIRAAGHQRALRDHTWQKRLQSAFEAMGLH
jgi:spore maturation protein CgeB